MRLKELVRRLRANAADASGQVVVLTALLFIPLVFFIGMMVVDVGATWTERRDHQSTADLSALAAVWEMPDEAVALDIALEWLTRNGIDVSDADRWEVDFPSASRVRVSVSRPYEPLFARILGFGAWDVGATAVAELRMEPVRYSLVTMNPTECRSLLVHGGANVRITGGGGSYVHSTCDSSHGALRVQGTTSELIAEDDDTFPGHHHVRGTAEGGGVLQPDADEYWPNTLTDPFAHVDPPEPYGSCNNTLGNVPDNHVLQPGCYGNQIRVQAGRTAYMAPGEYIFLRGIRVGGGATLSSAPVGDPFGTPQQVLIYETCDQTYPDPCNGTSTSGIDMDGGAQLNLLGHEGYENIIIFVDRTQRGGEVDLGGNSESFLQGSVYNIGGHVSVTGTPAAEGDDVTLNISIVADTISIGGNAAVNMPWDPEWAPVITYPALVE